MNAGAAIIRARYHFDFDPIGAGGRARRFGDVALAGLIARERPEDWTPPNMFRPPEVLTDAEVAEAEAELKEL